MTMDFPRGSEWRKWDLQVHAPGTKLNDCYAKKGGDLDWDQFCQIINESDVSAFGITDYFSLDGYFEFKKQYAQRYPKDHSKVFFPNIELRLPEVLNTAGESVNVHVVFRPDLSEADAHKFLISMDTETTTGKSKKTVVCSELKTRTEYESAVVSRLSLEAALKKTFGGGVPMENQAFIIASAKGDGIRPGGKSSRKRKNQLVDEIDKFAGGFFAGPGSRDHFLDVDRLEVAERVPSKPVFDGCDAHSFEDLIGRLGTHDMAEGRNSHATWIKADLTYEGLLQTRVEPAQRVAIQAMQPDTKQPYQYISKVKFSGTDDFPSEVLFNPSLNSIIGSRSSGKSALLAFVAHAVDPEATVEQQVSSSGIDPKDAGPAAGKSWAEVQGIKQEVEWGSADASTGKVIYIPQNALYSLSEQPEDASGVPDAVTEMISPSLMRHFPEFAATYSQLMSDVRKANDDIRAAVTKWFASAPEIDNLDQEIRDLGDKNAIRATHGALKTRVEEIKKKSKLTDAEIATHQVVTAELEAKEARLDELDSEIVALAPYATYDGKESVPVPGQVQVSITVRPDPEELPDRLGGRLEELRAAAATSLSNQVEADLASSLRAAVEEQARLRGEVAAIKGEHSDLFSKHSANADLEDASKDLEKQAKALAQIEKKETSRDRKRNLQSAEVSKITTALRSRADALDGVKEAFVASPRCLDDNFTFDCEMKMNSAAVTMQSNAFNRVKVTAYVKRKGEDADFAAAQADPSKFLEAIHRGQQELNRGYSKVATAQETIALAPEVRFTAELDGDRIGGFERSTMTPGKRALFALTLILNESQEPWPLLIDQPEDDLDSRSIYDTIVPYLMERKCERQIIMVSHDANLVIGADSEEVLVANRHGTDRPNHGERTFEYLTGALEHTQELNDKSPTVLGRHGIREHACEILDGGTEAFQKRKDKYKI